MTIFKYTTLGAALLVAALFAAASYTPDSRVVETSAVSEREVVQRVSPSGPGGLTDLSNVEESQLDGAKLVVKATIKAALGELVRFDVSESSAESFKWILVPGSGDFEVYDNGRRAVFSAREAGEYMFIVACAYEGTIDVVTHTVLVGDPPPKPGDYPRANQPSAGAAFSAWVSYWCSLTIRSEEEARKLADSFDGIAATISAGVNTTPAEIIKATGEANRQALGDSLESWKPVLLSLQNEFKIRANAGTLVSAEQHTATWREVAIGLRNYADLFETLTICE
jgi:hypothetical protein